MANRISGTSANRISWIDGHNMISMESLAPSLELEPEEEPEEPTFPTRAYTNSSTFTALPVPPLFPDTQKPMIPERSERRNTLLLEPSTPKPSPPRSIHGVKWGIAVLAILSSVFLFSLDQTIVADVQPAIVGHFGAVAKLPWLSVSLLLGAAATNLFWGKMYSQFNPKWLYIGTVALFELGSAICGAAPSMNALIVGRTIAGLGGAGMYLGVIMLLSFFTSPVERPRYIGMVGAMFGLGTVLGPLIGGAFADSAATWRWAFYINLCIGALFSPIYIFLLPGKDPQPGKSLLARLAEIDWIGTILITGVFVCGITPIAFGGTTYPWNSPLIISLFTLALILLTLLALQQSLPILTTTTHRIFPLQYLALKEMSILFAETAAAGTSSFITIYFIPLYFQFIKRTTALNAGIKLLPYILPLVLFTLLNGALMGKFGYYMPWFLAGGILMLVSNVMLYNLTLTTTPASYIYTAQVLGGIGTGLFVNAPFSVAQWLVPAREIPSAIGFIMCARVGGIALALAIANAVFLNLAENAISDILPSASRAEVQSAISGVGSALMDGLDADIRQQILEAIIEALRKGFTLGIAAGALSIALALFMDRERVVLKAPTPPAAAADKADKGGANA